jgi:DNA-binding MarR family transcriptional regulator
LRTVLALRFPETASVPQIRVLFRLSQHERLSLRNLAESERVSPPTMSRSIDALLAKGWVTRATSEEDRRSIWIALTPRGSSLVERVMRELNLQFARLLGAWADDSLSDLLKALNLLESSSLLNPGSTASLAPLEDDPKAPR